jgi:hypothetical protein
MLKSDEESLWGPLDGVDFGCGQWRAVCARHQMQHHLFHKNGQDPPYCRDPVYDICYPHTRFVPGLTRRPEPTDPCEQGEGALDEEFMFLTSSFGKYGHQHPRVAGQAQCTGSRTSGTLKDLCISEHLLTSTQEGDITRKG